MSTKDKEDKNEKKEKERDETDGENTPLVDPISPEKILELGDKISSKYKKSKYYRKRSSIIKYVEFALQIIATAVFPIMLYMQSFDDYEWICISGTRFCGKSENFNNLSKVRIAITAISVVFGTLIQL